MKKKTVLMRLTIRIWVLTILMMTGTVLADFFQPDAVDAYSGAIYSGASGGTKDGPGEWDAERPASEMIDGSGMPASYDETTVLASTYFTTAWLSEGSTISGTVLFSFNSAVDIASFVLWNNASTSDYSARGVQDFKIRFFDSAQNQIGSEYSATATMAPHNGLNVAADNFVFLSVYEDVKYVEWEILNNYGDSFVGAQEIGFTNTVPEPASVALLGIASVLGLFVRRRFLI